MRCMVTICCGALVAALLSVDAQAQGRPPTIDPLDPFALEDEPRRSSPTAAPTDQRPSGQPAAADTPQTAGRETEPAPDAGPAPVDLEALKRRLLDQGSAPLDEQEPAPPVRGQRVVLRGLDKMTGDLGETEAAVGETASLWRLEIDVKACFSREEASKSAAGSAFLQIRDTKNDGNETVFSGWMFAASPALSAMDHPRYDVWVLSCKTS